MANKKELTKLDHLIIESVIGGAEHEGYIDDGFMHSLLEKKRSGEITFEQAKKIVLERHLKI